MLVLALVVDMFADNLYIATVILPVATARYIGDFAVKCKPFVKLAYKFPRKIRFDTTDTLTRPGAFMTSTLSGYSSVGLCLIKSGSPTLLFCMFSWQLSNDTPTAFVNIGKLNVVAGDVTAASLILIICGFSVVVIFYGFQVRLVSYAWRRERLLFLSPAL